MNKLLLLTILTFLTSKNILSQNLLLNGSFENNIASGNTIHLSETWDSIVANSYHIDAGIQDRKSVV